MSGLEAAAQAAADGVESASRPGGAVPTQGAGESSPRGWS